MVMLVDVLQSRKWDWLEVEGLRPPQEIVSDPTNLAGADAEAQAVYDELSSHQNLDDPLEVRDDDLPEFLDALGAWASGPDVPAGASSLTILSLTSDGGVVRECALVGGESTEILTVAEVAEILKVSTKTVRQMLSDSDGDGGIPNFRLGVRTVRISRGDLDDWVRQQRPRVPKRNQPLEAATPSGQSPEKNKLRVYTRRSRQPIAI